MSCQANEPSLSEALSDPVILAVMKADGVDPSALADSLRRIARHIRSSNVGQCEPR